MTTLRRLFDPRSINLVLYHGNCHDGFGAAWVANTVLGSQAQYIGLVYGKNKEEYFEQFNPQGKNIVLIDFSFDLATCSAIKQLAKNFVILDHHKSAAETLSHLEYAHFDMNKSGITLAWEYFRDDPVPEFVKCIETHDLWKFAERKETCPHAKAFTAYWYNAVGQNPNTDFKHYHDLYYDQTMFYIYVEHGNILLGYIDNLIKKKGDDATNMIWTNQSGQFYRVKVINTDTLVSELGNYLSNMPNVDFVAMWTYSHKYKTYRVSLRSNGQTDVSEIAKIYSGGGHRAAAGFTLNVHPDTIFI